MSPNKPVAVITGASRGLGRALAETFAKQRYQLALVARSKKELVVLTQKINQLGEHAEYFVLDLTATDCIEPCIESIMQTFGRIDVLINNAGAGSYKPLLEHSVEEIESMIALNLTAPILWCRKVSQIMMQQGNGHIINIGSDLARKPMANMAPYVASKHGLFGFSQSLLREVKEHGVRVSSVNSGIIDTCFGDSEEGSQDPKAALQPKYLAELIYSLVNQPEYQLIDELVVHPLHQDF